jgi:hypothetical protein
VDEIIRLHVHCFAHNLWLSSGSAEIGWGLTYGHPEAFTVQDYVALGIYPPEYLVEPETPVRVLPTPDIVHIVVCGDPDRNRIMTLWSGYVQPVTKPIELPGHWDTLVAGGEHHAA